MRLLRNNPHAILWLMHLPRGRCFFSFLNSLHEIFNIILIGAHKHLKMQAAAHGINPDRLVNIEYHFSVFSHASSGVFKNVSAERPFDL